MDQLKMPLFEGMDGDAVQLAEKAHFGIPL